MTIRKVLRKAAMQNQPITLVSRGQQFTFTPQVPSPRERVVRGFLSTGKFAVFMIDELTLSNH